jgi:hypothetical protein
MTIFSPNKMKYKISDTAPSQAIQTRFLGQTYRGPARIKAIASMGESVTTQWDYNLGTYENHACAALRLLFKLNWDGYWQAGSTRNGYVFVKRGNDE